MTQLWLWVCASFFGTPCIYILIYRQQFSSTSQANEIHSGEKMGQKYTLTLVYDGVVMSIKAFHGARELVKLSVQ